MSDFIFGDESNITIGNIVENPLFATRTQNDYTVKPGRSFLTVNDEGIAHISTDEDKVARNIQGEVFFFPVGEVYYRRSEGRASLGNVATRVARGAKVGPKNRSKWAVGSWLAIIPVKVGSRTIYTVHFGLVGEQDSVAPNGNLSLDVKPPQNAKDLDLVVTGWVHSVISEMLGHRSNRDVDGSRFIRDMTGIENIVAAVQRRAKQVPDLSDWATFRDAIAGSGGEAKSAPIFNTVRNGQTFTRRSRSSQLGAGSQVNVSTMDTLDRLNALSGT